MKKKKKKGLCYQKRIWKINFFFFLKEHHRGIKIYTLKENTFHGYQSTLKLNIKCAWKISLKKEVRKISLTYRAPNLNS